MKPKKKSKEFIKSGARMYETKSSGSGFHSDKRKKLKEKYQKREERLYNLERL